MSFIPFGPEPFVQSKRDNSDEKVEKTRTLRNKIAWAVTLLLLLSFYGFKSEAGFEGGVGVVPETQGTFDIPIKYVIVIGVGTEDEDCISPRSPGHSCLLFEAVRGGLSRAQTNYSYRLQLIWGLTCCGAGVEVGGSQFPEIHKDSWCDPYIFRDGMACIFEGEGKRYSSIPKRSDLWLGQFYISCICQHSDSVSGAQCAPLQNCKDKQATSESDKQTIENFLCFVHDIPPIPRVLLSVGFFVLSVLVGAKGSACCEQRRFVAGLLYFLIGFSFGGASVLVVVSG